MQALLKEDYCGYPQLSQVENQNSTKAIAAQNGLAKVIPFPYARNLSLHGEQNKVENPTLTVAKKYQEKSKEELENYACFSVEPFNEKTAETPFISERNRKQELSAPNAGVFSARETDTQSFDDAFTFAFANSATSRKEAISIATKSAPICQSSMKNIFAQEKLFLQEKGFKTSVEKELKSSRTRLKKKIWGVLAVITLIGIGGMIGKIASSDSLENAISHSEANQQVEIEQAGMSRW